MNIIDEFKKSVSVIDTETTHLFPDQCEIVEIARANWSKNEWHVDSMLLGAYSGIPPEASAKNNISNKMIQGKPKFDQNVKNIKTLLNWDDSKYFIAHNASYDRIALSTAFTKIHNGTDIKICKDDNRWLCTWRLSKHILNHEFSDIQYGLGYLRYFLDLDVPDSYGAHRADIDTFVCAKLLDKLIDKALENKLIDLNEDIGVQLNKLCWSPIEIKKWPFGKNKGLLLSELTNDYYMWALKNIAQLQEDNPSYDYDLAESVRQLLETRLTNN